jgi:hypothetical protein
VSISAPTLILLIKAFTAARDRHPTAPFRESEVQHLAFLDQLLHSPRDVLDRDVRIEAMLIEQVDPVGPQSPQRFIRDPSNLFRPAVTHSRQQRRWVRRPVAAVVLTRFGASGC